MSIGEQIKKARQNKGYTQQELADMLGVAKNTVTGYERGNRAPDALKIKAIAKALGVTGNWLMECEHIIKPKMLPLIILTYVLTCYL